MKNFKFCIASLAIFAMIFTSCSKEETSVVDPDGSNSESVVLTFGAVLNDLANRSTNKAHFDQVPTCSDADPAFAIIGFSVDGEENPDVTVAILSDSNGYFTAYSEALKILVPSGESVTITLNSFIVYDGDPEDDSSEIIWIAPIEDEEGEFDGYVDNALPFDFELEAGTKPYIDIEVLCFDRRMVNEYGYVFFDILPETIYPLCLFVNYCNEDGRHWVADYAVDLYFGTNSSGIMLYDHLNPNAMAENGVINGQFFADPLCLVVPGPPANLPADEPYLYLIIYPQDWDDNYGDIDNTPVPVQLTWEMVEDLLNGDGTTNEYLHLLVGECEGALPGDGSGGENGECDPLDPDADCNDNGIPNECDPDAANYDTFDCDEDGVLNGDDTCPTVAGTLSNGCVDETDSCANLPDACTIPQTDEDLEEGCNFVYFDFDNQDDFLLINGVQTDIILENSLSEPFGKVNTSQSGGDVSISIDGELIDDLIIAYEIEVRPSQNGSMSTTCWESSCDSDVIAVDVSDRDQAAINLSFSGFDYAYPYYIRIKAISCGADPQ